MMSPSRDHLLATPAKMHPTSPLIETLPQAYQFVRKKRLGFVILALCRAKHHAVTAHKSNLLVANRHSILYSHQNWVAEDSQLGGDNRLRSLV